MIKAVIFDMDGVIVDSEPIMDIVLIQFFDEMNIEFDKNIAKNFRGGSSEAFWRELKRIYSLPGSVDYYVNERLKRTIEYYRKHGIKLIENVINLIEEFKNLDLKIALATSAAHERMQVTLDMYGDQDLSKADIVVQDFKENSRKNIFEFFGLNMSLLRS